MLYLWIIRLKLSQIWSRITIVFSIIVCSMQSQIFSSFFEILSCDGFQSDDSSYSYYIHSDSSEKCYTSSYYSWVISFIIPAFGFYGILLPLMAFIYIFINRKNLYETQVLNRVGFLLNGYKKDKFYWEFLLFFRKLTLNLVIIFWNKGQPSFFVLITIYLSTILVKKNQPFLTKKLNSFEFYSNNCCGFILMVALLSENFDSEIGQLSCMLVMILLNLVFLFSILRIIFTFKLNEISAVKKFRILERIVEQFFNGINKY